MYYIQIVLLILLINLSNSIETDDQSCLSRSIERIFLENNEKKIDCSTLSSPIQTTLALHLTFCHLNSTGINPETICSLSSIDQHNFQACLKNITMNSFAYLTYTNFLPHIQSICYAMETQRWHNHARNTVVQLHEHSNRVEHTAKKLLMEQERSQANLDQALIVNQQNVEDAVNVDRFLQLAQSDVDELRGHLYVKDKVQIELIQQILQTLFNVQTSLFADAFGLTSYIFYAVSLIAIHIVTLPQRTSDSKFWLILLWIGLVGVERYMLFFSSYSQIILYDILWRCRQLWFLISCLILTHHAVRYRNYYKENQKLIEEIDRKHKQLEKAARKCLNVINQLDRINNSISDDSSDFSTDDNNTSTSTILSDDEKK